MGERPHLHRVEKAKIEGMAPASQGHGPIFSGTSTAVRGLVGDARSAGELMSDDLASTAAGDVGVRRTTPRCGGGRRGAVGGVATAARRAAVWRQALQLRRGAPPCGGRRCNCGEARRSAVRGAAGRPRVAAGEPDASAMLRVTPSFFVPTLRGHTFVLCPDP